MTPVQLPKLTADAVRYGWDVEVTRGYGRITARMRARRESGDPES